MFAGFLIINPDDKKVPIPVTFKLFVVVSPLIDALPTTVSADVAFVVPIPTLLVVLIPVGYVVHWDEVPPVADTVAIPEPKVTDKLDVKSIVPAVPTVEPLFLTTTPEPDAVIFVSKEPSPENLKAVIIPEVLILAVVENPRAVVAVVAVPVIEIP